jgi:hypothetical protein
MRYSSQGGAGGGAWSSTPAPVMKVGGRVLLCSLADLPRDFSARVPRPSGTTAEAAFVIVDESDAPPMTTTPHRHALTAQRQGQEKVKTAVIPSAPRTSPSRKAWAARLFARGPAQCHLVREHTPLSRTRDLCRGRRCGRRRGIRTTATVL